MNRIDSLFRWQTNQKLTKCNFGGLVACVEGVGQGVDTHWLNQVATAPAGLGINLLNEIAKSSATSFPIHFMITLRQYFNDERIIDHLCKARLKLAASRNERQYISRLVGNIPEVESERQLYRMFPGRKRWNSSRPRNRRAGLNPDLHALNKTVRVLRRRSPNEPCVVELNSFITAIQERVLGSQPFELIPPLIDWELKKNHDYRALCRFTLADNLILSLFSKFLRDALDSRFSPASFAFRSRRNGVMPNHHQAFSAIYELKHNNPNQDYYVAECDIRGFFDTVDHNIALAAYREAAHDAELDIRADQIFRAYLNCYSFPVNVLAEAGPRLRQEDPVGKFPWPAEALLKHHADPMAARIGVPQGGAISGVIANLILDAADKCVEKQRKKLKADINYLRYCDDMVLISPKKKHCESVFEAYKTALDNLKLVYHRPETTWVYGEKHWGNKSKAPYLWSGRRWFGAVPWVQFVGYQVRYDGLVRPKKDSTAKEVRKLKEKTAQIISRLRLASRSRHILANKDQALASLKHKLTAQGVGRIKGGERSGPKPMSWASGFRALHDKPFVSHALRLLDGIRHKQIGRFAGARIRYGQGRNSRSGHGRNPVGYEFSYHGQYTNGGGQNLIDNPWRPRNLKDRLKMIVFRIVTGRMTKRCWKYIWSRIT